MTAERDLPLWKAFKAVPTRGRQSQSVGQAEGETPEHSVTQ